MSVQELRRIQLLPLEEPVPEENRLGILAPELRRIRSEGLPLSRGQILTSQGQKFVIFKCDPEEGRLGMETDFFTNGQHVVIFSKIQLNAIRRGPSNPSQDTDFLFNEYIKPYFFSLGSAKEKTILLEANQKLYIFDLLFEVKATEPADRMGIVQADTIVYSNWDSTPDRASQEQMMMERAMAMEQAMAQMSLFQSMAPRRPPQAGQLEDPELAAALEQSYLAGTSAGQAMTEDEMLMQAIQASKMEEENRQRQSLRQQQEAELQESVLMDQMREAEEKQKRLEEEQKRLEEEKRLAEETKRREQAEVLLQEKRSRLAEEPQAGEPGRLQIVLRLPNGQRLQRAFRNSETVGLIYDFVDIQQLPVLDGKKYRLIQNMPRTVYEDKTSTLERAGISNQSVLMVEVQVDSGGY